MTKIEDMTHEELVKAYENAVVDCVMITNFPSRKSLDKANKWEVALKNELIFRLQLSEYKGGKPDANPTGNPI